MLRILRGKHRAAAALLGAALLGLVVVGVVVADDGFSPPDPETPAIAAGGSKTYVEALEPFGLDPRRKAFWEGGLGRLERLVDEFEALS